MKIVVDLDLSKECIVQIEGDYTKKEENTWFSSSLDITGISFLKGGPMEYTQWCNDIMEQELSTSIVSGISEDCLWDILTNLVLTKYEESL